MQRRNFIKTGSIAALSLSTLSATAHQVLPTAAHDDIHQASLDTFDLDEITISRLQEKMQAKVWTSRMITEKYLKRIAEIDKSGPMLNAVIELNKDALSIADALDKERAAGKLRGPMHGIPVLIKDNINTGDRMLTTAGSIALSDNHAATDAFIVTQLRAAGAVILGKTNLSEWANFRSSNSTSAWSSRGGQTKNPYILDRNPSGSSAGSGSATAANLCAVSIGTETDGSIVSPASVNGLVGIKPTVGLLSRSGIIPISATQDTAGPMARTVSDAAIILAALTGVDTKDSYTLERKGKAKTDYTPYLDINGLKGKRLGIEKSALTGNPAMLKLLNEAIATLKKQGAEVVEVELLKALRSIGNAEFQVLLYEFKDGLNSYLSTSASKIKSLEALIAFNKTNEEKAMPFFKQDILEQAQQKGGLDSKEYLDALAKSRGTSRAAIDALLKEKNLDAIIAPTNGFAVCIDLINGDYDNGFSFSAPAARAGYPHITVPMGNFNELPMGLSFVGTAYAEPQLIQLAYAYEQASKKRQKPKFKNVIL
ncbi:MAG: amidase [Pedobacter sp.]|nr:MAG: amidase [Pedobacter sp.]